MSGVYASDRIVFFLLVTGSARSSTVFKYYPIRLVPLPLACLRDAALKSNLPFHSDGVQWNIMISSIPSNLVFPITDGDEK